MAFVKLDTTMLRSSIWVERDHRSLFVTALLMCEPFEVSAPMAQLEVRSLNETGWMVPAGWYGLARAAGSGIVRTDGMEQEAGLDALEVLGSTDPESRSQDFEGRRLVRVDGGFLCLNYMKYRDHDHTAAERQRRLRERKKNAGNALPVTRYEVEVTRDVALQSHIAEGREQRAEADTKEKKQRAPKDGATWLTPYLLAWEAKNGAGSGVAIAGRLAKALRPLHDANGEASVLDKLAIYLSQTDAQFRSPQSFAQRFSSWGEVSAPVATKQQQSTAALTGWLNQQEQTDGLLDHDSGNTRLLRRALPRRADFGSDG